MSAGDIELRLADPVTDEADIRALVGSVAMPGAVSVRFQREPDYFLGTTIMGDPCDVLVARACHGGKLAGIACRAEQRTFVNGAESTTGYIGQIRVATDYEGLWLVQRGARMVRDLSAEGLIYLGVVARENPRARSLLVERRPPAGLRATRISGLTTCAILVRNVKQQKSDGFLVRPASRRDLDDLLEFLRQHGPRRQFFPAYTAEDLTGGPRLRDLALEDVMVAWRGDAVRGVMAAWDQSAYKQDVVDGYGDRIRRVRWLFDATARVLGAMPLTRPRETIPLAFAACTCVADDDAEVMHALIAHCVRHVFRRHKAYLMLGLSDDDPLLATARKWPHVTYRSDMYAVSWSVDPAAELDGRIPYVEIATL